MAPAPKSLPRSPAGLLAGQLTEEPISRSSSNLSSVSGSSPLPHPRLFQRRSTGASGELDYYWSSLAGAGPGSSSSSIAVSPSPSHAGLGVSPHRPSLLHSNSSLDVSRSQSSQGSLNPPKGDMMQGVQMGKTRSFPGNGLLSPDQARSNNSSGSFGQTLDTRFPSSGAEVDSPGGWSGDSDYSNDGEGTDRSFSAPEMSKSSSYGFESQSPVDYRLTNTEFGEPRRPLLEPSTKDSEFTGLYEARGSVASQSTQATYKQDEDPNEKTPMAPVYADKEDREIQPPGPLTFGRPSKDYPTRQPAVSSPIRQSTPAKPTASPSAAGYKPTSGRSPFLPGLDNWSSPLPSPRKVVEQEEVSLPHSAPAWTLSFDRPVNTTGDVEEQSKRATLPAFAVEPFPSVSHGDTATSEQMMLSPEKQMRLGAVTPEKTHRSREASPVRSPEPPPRSSLRTMYSPQVGTSTPKATDIPTRLESPRPIMSSVPTIINTPHSPEGAPIRSAGVVRLDATGPKRPSRSPSRSPSFSHEATMQDLTDMLGDAIDAIGLIDSRDTPPPTVFPPKKDKPDLRLGHLAPAADVRDAPPITPTSLPSRADSLSRPSSSGAASHPEGLSRRPSALSVRDTNRFTQPSVQPQKRASLSHRPWPAAMLFGNIRGMKYAGERAKAYAQNINDLARADSGLREWCAASTSTSSRPIVSATKSAAMSSLGVRSSGLSTTSTLAVPNYGHMRNVSTSSEFPMRADAYSAREISQRAVDPTDAPGSLPPNLPYPALQAQYASGAISSSGGMKPSPSMQSVSSFSSKRSFFGGIGKKSSKKEQTSLGPPSGSIIPGKKDLRGLAISSPTLGGSGKSSSPHRLSDSVSAPLGPRGPRIGSFTPPPQPAHQLVDPAAGRASLDTGLSRISSNPRRSIDSALSLNMGQSGRKGSVPPRAGSLNVTYSEEGVDESQLRAMCDILPHVSSGVLKVYLAKYGDQMQAIGMYLEDEKRGKVMRA